MKKTKVATGDGNNPEASSRLYSLDVMRGLQMIWGSVGLSLVITKYAELTQRSFWLTLNHSVATHADWIGLHVYDLIFPGFIFVMGILVAVVLDRRKYQDHNLFFQVLQILKRTLILILLGVIINGVFQFDGWESFRIFGVLQKIGLTYFVIALLALFLRTRWILLATIITFAGYWYLLTQVAVPGFGPGIFTPEGNIVYYVDRLFLLPNQMLYPGLGDPEGILSTISTVSLGLGGVLVGRFIQIKQSPYLKWAVLCGVGLLALLLGYSWAPYLPLIKKIWTSSYILMSWGWLLFIFSSLYLVTDVWRLRSWAYPLAVVGYNPLFMYVAVHIIDFEGIARFLTQGFQFILPTYYPLILALAGVGVRWYLLFFMYRKKIHIKI